MNGQLSEQPLVELIREISAKSLGGRLRLEQERVKIVAYFDSGNFLYAASNLRTLRIREYLLKSNLASEQDLTQFNDRVSDTDIVKVLCAQNLLARDAAEQVQTRQVADVLRVGLLWTEGSWDFDSRSHLNEKLNLKIDVTALLLEAARRLPAKFAASSFPNPTESIASVQTSLVHENLLPAEGYLLSRLDRPMRLSELLAISGLPEAEVMQHVYSLALAGFIKRDEWPGARQTSTTSPEVEKAAPPPPREQPPRETEVDPTDIEKFLQRIKRAETHYDVLGVNADVAGADLKNVYYQLARRYHPDRFRKAEGSLLSRIESAFARIAQAYDTLRDDALRANYNTKIAARKKAQQVAEAASKPVAPTPQPEQLVVKGAPEPTSSVKERAEAQFKEGVAALELGERKAAIGLFASAANAVPNEPRYRAFYGHMLAGNERTRRAAERELLAAVQLDPGNANYRVMLAELYRDLGLKLRAKGEAERAVAADPENSKARELLRAMK